MRTLLFSLREIYELRHVTRESERVSVGRLFIHNKKFGIKDISGALWPIFFETQKENSGSVDIDIYSCPQSLKEGDVLKFSGIFNVNRFHVKDIKDVTKQTAVWNNTVVPIPLDIKIEKKKGMRTSYFPHQKIQNRFYTLEKRASALERTKQFFTNRGFFHAETPILVPSGGMETYLHTFQTKYFDYQRREWTLELPTSPEFALKKLLAQGIPKVFQIAHAFRNYGEHSPLHEPEFMMLEWYRTGGTLRDIMLDTQKLVLTLAQYLKSKKRIPQKWKIFRVQDLFLNLMNLNLPELQNKQEFYEKSRHLSMSLCETDTWDDIFCKLFMEKIEPFLKNQMACFVTGYPMQMGALAKNEDANPLFVQRMEAYLFGVEICNGYQELTDVNEFEKRFETVLSQRSDNMRRDADFENVLKFGLPSCSGNAVGVDRVIALLLGLNNIQSLFPIPFSSQL